MNAATAIDVTTIRITAVKAARIALDLESTQPHREREGSKDMGRTSLMAMECAAFLIAVVSRCFINIGEFLEAVSDMLMEVVTVERERTKKQEGGKPCG
jgi:hypothetical protein